MIYPQTRNSKKGFSSACTPRVRPGGTRAAFTLVELLVVIVIIAALIGLILPVVSSVGNKAKIAQSVNNLRQIGVGMQTLMNDGVPGLDGGVGAFPSYAGSDGGLSYNWHDLVAETLGIAERTQTGFVYNVDPVKSILQNPAKKLADGVDPKLFHLNPRDTLRTGSYGYNYLLADWSSDTFIGPGSFFGAKTRTKMMLVEKPAQLLVVCESNGDAVYDGHAHPYWKAAWPGNHDRGGCNVLFADWHVEWKTQLELRSWQPARRGLNGYARHFDPKQGKSKIEE